MNEVEWKHDVLLYTHVHMSFYSQDGDGGEAKDTEVAPSPCMCRGVSMADRKGYM